MNDAVKNILLWVVIAVVLMAVFNNFMAGNNRSADLAYSQFVADVKSGQVRSVEIGADNRTIKGYYHDNSRFVTYSPNDPALVDDLLSNSVEIITEPTSKPSLLIEILISWFPMILLIGVWIFFMRQMQNGGAGGRGINETYPL